MNTITLSLPFPPSVNNAYANSPSGGRHKTQRYKDWFKEASIQVKDRHRINHAGPYTLYIALRSRDKRARDLGNYEKCVSDFLVEHGIVKDDSQSTRIILEWDNAMASDCLVVVHPISLGTR